MVFLLAVQGALKSLEEHKSKASIVQQSAAFMVQLTSVHDYWKSHTFDYMDLCPSSVIFNISGQSCLSLDENYFKSS